MLQKGWKEDVIKERYGHILERLEMEGIVVEGKAFKWKRNNRVILRLKTYEVMDKVLMLCDLMLKPEE